MYRTALRNVLAHKGRLLMTALAIMFGTAFVAGTLVFSDTARHAAKNSYSRDFTDVSVMVTDRAVMARNHRGSARLTDTTVRQIAALPGVERAFGVVSDFTGVSDKKGVLIGQVSNARGANFIPGDPRHPMIEGRGPRTGGEIALDSETASNHGYRVGDTVRIAANGPVVAATLTGIFTADGSGTLTLMDTASAQKMLLTPGRYGSIEVTAKPGTAETTLRSQITAIVAAGDQVTTQTSRQLRDEQAEMVENRIHSLTKVLLAFASISLFVGIFIIANTFTMLIAQRTRELALLRAIGAGRSQVTLSVLLEALAIGVTASAAGMLAGIGIGAGLRATVGSINHRLPSGPLVISPGTVAVVLTVGVLVTVLSAVPPAVRAARIPPIAAMNSGDQPSTRRSLLIRNTLGSLITAGGLGTVLLGTAASGTTRQQEIALGAVLASIGVVVLLPLLCRPAIALTGPVLAGLCGTPGRLARLNAVRNPRRTGATAAAIAIGLTLITALTVVGASVTDAMDRTVDSGMKADYSVALATGHDLTPQLAEQIAKAPGVTAASPVTKVHWRVDGQSRSVEGVDVRLVGPTMTSGSADAQQRGRALINATLAKSDDLAVGSTMRMGYPDGTTGTLTVGGVFEDNQLHSAVLLSNAVITEHEPTAGIAETLVKGTGELRQSIKDATGGNPVIDVRDRQDMRNEISRSVTTALSIMQAMLGMSVLVAALGMINTMAMSVLERRREIGLLRAVGLDRHGVRQMVCAESVVISGFGALTGMALGTYLAWAGLSTFDLTLPNLTTVVPYGQLLLFLLLAGLVGMLAALGPSYRAARADILDSIKSD
jgi:putative ABC transport system permease protein